MNTTPILIVDDEATVLELYQVQLCQEFHVDTAESGEQALALLGDRGPYAVVIADMHMPGVSGSDLLNRIRNIAPDTVRIMLTSDERQSVVRDAVNRREVFRFLNKPCPAEELAKAVRAGLQHYHIRQNEKELLSSTMDGCIQLLVEMLSLVNPLAFGRALRTKRIVQSLVERLGVQDGWEITIAALLSHIGCITLPESILAKIQRGKELTTPESHLYRSHPQLGHDLITKIPRLNRIADIISMQQRPHTEHEVGDDAFDTIARRAALLKITLDYDLLASQGQKPEHAIRQLMAQSHLYDSRLLEALKEIIENEQKRRVSGVSFARLEVGMVLQEDLVDARGAVLVTQGHEITDWLLDRLRRQRDSGRTILEPIRVLEAEQKSSGESSSLSIPTFPKFTGNHAMDSEPAFSNVMETSK